MEIRPFGEPDVDAAASLFVAAYAEQRQAIPELPDTWEDPAPVARLLRQVVASGPAMATSDGSRLIGYLAGWILGEEGDAEEDGPWVFVPEWAHGAADRRRRIWEELYAAILPRWLERGARIHRVSLLAADRELGETLDWLSFGTTTVDAARGTGPVAAARYRVRRAGVADTEAVTALREALRRHLQGTPVYLVQGRPIDPATERAKLEDPAIATLLAEADAGAVGFLRIGPSADDVATIVQDAATASITGAFTVADRRGTGIGSCLLDEALAWARAEGYLRVAVDFEPMNVLAARFWTATFRPVALTKTRIIDRRAVAER